MARLFWFAASITVLCGCGEARLGSAAASSAGIAVPPLGSAAKDGSLLYISEDGSSFGQVAVYGYHNGTASQLVETLTGFRDPNGMCTDKAGNVWVTDRTLGTITKYAHDGTLLEHLHEPGGHPRDCAIDPVTGDLAVANSQGSHGGIRVYRPNAHEGTPYKFPGGPDRPDSLAYDDSGNLIVVGFQGYLYKLAPGAPSLVQLNLSGGTLYGPAGIQWINPNFLVATQTPQGAAGDRVSVTGNDATIVGSIPFQGSSELTTIWRRADNVIVPDAADNIVRIYRLSDGSLVSTLSNQIFHPYGVVVSQIGTRH